MRSATKFLFIIKSLTMQRFILLLLVSTISFTAFGQLKPRHEKAVRAIPLTAETVAPPAPLRPVVPQAAPLFSGERLMTPIPHFARPVKNQPSLKAWVSPETSTPYFIEGQFQPSPGKSTSGQVYEYLDAVQPVLNINEPSKELSIANTETDQLGFTHVRLQQNWQGLRVYGAEAVLHKNQLAFYLLNGRFYPTPSLPDVTPLIDKEAAIDIALADVAAFTSVKTLTQPEKELLNGSAQVAELVVYHVDQKEDGEHLAWHVQIVPNLAARYSYFIDAKTGEIFSYHSELCQLVPGLSTPPPDGPATANALDLLGQTRLINTYVKSNVFYLMDASRSMFNGAQSSFPDDPAGVIWTIDAQNTSPENSNFQAAHIVTLYNTWNDPKSVSAHYNGGKAFEYFKNTFNRNSINGQGGNIVSLINVVESDNTQMDNAFWNGAAMFYGNGNQAFVAPLCKALDVSGHEMSHGVIQSTANLEYIGESGALNESFADVFGAMIDRDDWQMGEDVVNNSIFPTGALRDLSNPHNGGSNLNDAGWQPANYSEHYTGSQDNGGVHINSGIPNKAFQLFADNGSVGKNRAEQVYYRALTLYLFKSAQFVDCRNAVIQAANDLYGAAVANAAAAAFTAVGIGAGSGTDSQTDIGANPGDEFILMSDAGYSGLYIFTPDGVAIANPLSGIAPLSRPSVTDDGSVIVYIASDNTMRAITIDWQSGQANPQIIQSDPIWRNVTISKDGNHLAALTTDYDNKLWIFDYGLQQWGTYELFNPTTGQGGPTTGDVQYADVLEWDFTGEWVMYDALNSINTTGANGIEYWDISFTRAWSNGANNFGDGYTEKLFSGLPEDVSVGNPTFSKNSDYIIALDYIDDFTGEYYLLGANIETGGVGTIFQNTSLSWPNYSMDDDRLVFDSEDNFGTPVLAFISLGSDKINPSGNASVYLEQGRWGVWFANGDRVLVDATEPVSGRNFRLYPNPVSDFLTIDFAVQNGGLAQAGVFDLMGKKVRTEQFNLTAGNNSIRISLAGLPGGPCVVRLMTSEENAAFKVVKE